VGQPFAPGELEREVEALQSDSGDGGLEAAMLLTQALMEDYEELKEDAQQQEQKQSSGVPSAEFGMERTKALSARMRLALLHRLGRTAVVLKAFGEQRRKATEEKRHD